MQTNSLEGKEEVVAVVLEDVALELIFILCQNKSFGWGQWVLGVQKILKDLNSHYHHDCKWEISEEKKVLCS